MLQLLNGITSSQDLMEIERNKQGWNRYQNPIMEREVASLVSCTNSIIRQGVISRANRSIFHLITGSILSRLKFFLY